MISCEEKNKTFVEAITKYSETLETRMAAAGEELHEDVKDEEENWKKVPATFKFNVTWQITDIPIPIVEMTMREQKLIYDVPQITMNDKEIKFHTPSVRMVKKKVGQYPETRCEETWIRVGGMKTKGPPKCTVHWFDIIIDVPESFLEEQRLVVKVPELKMDTTTTTLKVPDFKVSQQNIKLHLPQFTLEEVIFNSDDEKKRAEEKHAEMEQYVSERTKEFQSKVERVREEAKTDVILPLNEFFECLRAQVRESRSLTESGFQMSIVQLEAAIKFLKDKGADNTHEANELRTKLDGLHSQLAEKTKDFDQQLQDLLTKERETVASLGVATSQ